MNPKGIDTLAVHAGESSPRVEGAVVLPIFQSATFEHFPEDANREKSTYDQVRYLRLNNSPNHHCLHEKIAQLEQAEEALVTASGMAAITTALLSSLKAGDHLLCQKTLYGGTFDFVTKDLERFGIHYDFVDPLSPESWKEKLRPETRVLYLETISNPLMEVPALQEAVAFAREHQLLSMIDNTFASPINFRPCPMGFDLCLHSATKYLNGHSDIVAGVIAGSQEPVDQARLLLNHMGGSLDPHACFLLQRGLKTLGLRVRAQNHNALALAQSLSNHPSVANVFYPGLKTHPTHHLASTLLDGYGGMLSFELVGGLEAAHKLLSHLELAIVAPSLGGVESLVTLPAISSHAGLSPEERQAVGVSDGLVRVSVGIESEEDLLKDFEGALESS